MSRKQKLKIFLLILFMLFCIISTLLVTTIFPSLEYYGFFDRHPLVRIIATALIKVFECVRRWFLLLVLFLYVTIIGYLFLKNFQKKKLLSTSKERRGSMEIFFEYWKRGWKVWLMMTCVSFSYVLLFLPVAIVIGFLKCGTGVYYLISAILGLTLAPVLTYFVFKLFYGDK